jgi:hypothetical protein
MVTPELAGAFDNALGAPGPLDVNPLGAPIDTTNVFQQLAPQAPAIEAPTGKRSILDVIGGISDVVANVGGAQAQYQPRLDAAQQRADEERARQRQQVDYGWQDKFNTQKYSKGENELRDDQVTRFGQAARGLSAVLDSAGPEGVARAFPALAQQLGLSPEEADVFGRSLQSNPRETIETLRAATDPTVTGSQPKELTIYRMLQKEDPEQAEEYLRNITSGINPYQQGQLQLGRDRLVIQERTNRERNLTMREGIRTRAEIARDRLEADRAKAAAKDGGGTTDTRAFSSVLGGLRKNYADLDREGGLVRAGGNVAGNVVARARASAAGQLVEGAVGTKAQTYRDNIKNSRPAIVQAIKAATGMSSKQLDSNADMKLALMQATDPTQSRETNEAAMQRLEDMVANSKPAAKPAAPARNGNSRGGSRPTLKPRPAGRKSGPSVSNW